jgi:hypothetical protein
MNLKHWASVADTVTYQFLRSRHQIATKTVSSPVLKGDSDEKLASGKKRREDQQIRNNRLIDVGLLIGHVRFYSI